MSEKEIILPEDDKAATYRTDIAGWVSRQGFFYGENGEGSARYDGATHRTCARCDAVIRKHRPLCDACKLKYEIDNYNRMPKSPWDGEAPLYSDLKDTYYHDLCEALDDLEDGQALADLRLVICEPNKATISIDLFADYLPDDSDAPDELLAAIEDFNEAMAAVTLSWHPGRYALEIGDE